MKYDLPIGNLTLDEWYERNLEFLQSQFIAAHQEDFFTRDQYCDVERHHDFDPRLEEQYDAQAERETNALPIVGEIA